MRPYQLKYITYTGILFCLTACDGNCKDEIIEKTEWVTAFESQPVDTLLNFTVLENKTQYDLNTKQAVHSVVIRNDNSKYANKFSITINYMIFDSDFTTKEKVYNSESVEIEPLSTFQFIFSRQAEHVINFNSNVIVNQSPLNLIVKKRVESLKVEAISVNSCDENVAALKERYKAIKELYNSRLKVQGI